MNDTKTDITSWQFRLQDFSNNTCKGVRLIAARKGSRGRWLAYDRLPAYVRDYFLPEVREGVTFVGDYVDIAALLASLSEGEATTARSGEEGRIVWGKAPAGHAVGVITLRAADVAVSVQNLDRLPAFTSGDGTKWGVSDFYGEKEGAMRAALANRADFTTGWFSSKKECASGRVSRLGDQVLCQASVSDDFDCEGTGSVTVLSGRKGVDRLFEAIQRGLDRAYDEALENQSDNSVVALWKVVNKKGSWMETYLRPMGDAYDMDRPPGDNYHRWGWQGEGRVPAKVKRAFGAFIESSESDTVDEFKFGGFTFTSV